MNKKLLTLSLLTATAIFCTGAYAQEADDNTVAADDNYINQDSADTGMARPHSHPMIPAGDPAVQPNPQNLATEPTAQKVAPQPDADSSVPVVTGGIGEEMEQLKSVQGQYSLKLLITEQNGTFLSNVDVQITDKQGNTVVDTTTQGPVLLAKLPKGTYTVIAKREDGETKQFKATTSGKLHAYQVAFDDTDPRVTGDAKTTPLE